ncbi:flagellar biosynthetic protein FliO [Deferrisoma palaeochoriense]
MRRLGLVVLALLAALPAWAGQAVVDWEYGYVNVRSAPKGRKVARLDKGARVETLDERAGWTRIRFDGRTGWVVTRSLKPLPPAAPEPQEAPAAERAPSPETPAEPATEPAAPAPQAVPEEPAVREEPAAPPAAEPEAPRQAGRYLAEYLDRPEEAPPAAGGAWLRILSGFFLVLALIGGGVWVARMVLGRRSGLGRGTGPIRVLATRPLGPRQGLLLVETGGLVWLLAQGPEGIRPIAEIRDPDAIKRLNERYGFLESPFEAELRRRVDLESGEPEPGPADEPAPEPSPEERLAALRRRPRPGEPT